MLATPAVIGLQLKTKTLKRGERTGKWGHTILAGTFRCNFVAAKHLQNGIFFIFRRNQRNAANGEMLQNVAKCGKMWQNAGNNKIWQTI